MLRLMWDCIKLKKREKFRQWISMYVEEIRAERKGKKYCTYLVRESYREGSKVRHRTIANISHLPRGCIEEIKQYLKSKSGKLDFSKLRILGSKEFGASQALLLLSRQLKLDSAISPRKSRAREDLLALVISRVIYPYSLFSLASKNSDTMLWRLCGCSFHQDPDASQFIFSLIDQLRENQHGIQKRLAKRHLKDSEIALGYLTSTDVFKRAADFNEQHGHHGLNFDRELVMSILWTNGKGCPWAVEMIGSDQIQSFSFQESTSEILKKAKSGLVVIVGDARMLSNKHLDEAKRKGYKTVTSLTSLQQRDLIARNMFSSDAVSNGGPQEACDPTDPTIRYILSFRPPTRAKRLETEKDVGKQGDFYILRSDVPKDAMSASEIVHAFQELPRVNHSFKLSDLLSPEADPFDSHSSEGLSSYLFFNMLSYYLQWHLHEKLRVASIDELGRHSSRLCREAIELLKMIRTQTIQIEKIVLEDVRSSLNPEQEKIISCLGISF